MTTASPQSPAHLPIAVGADEVGAALKDTLAQHLRDLGHEVVDLSASPAEDYPEVAARVAEAVAAGTYERAVLVCGTGIGMAITANKVPGVRAAQIPDTYSAERARKSNDAQIACFGHRTMGVESAKQCLEHWLGSEFAGGGSAPKVEKIKRVEARFLGAA
ncbi:RpiB/LacA/LacB family sugar-phosphate isomerase [Streptomyces sp. NPDC002176]|uniref:RpiB/LacA/LacB family sugar-phosphate isomerase n=1 Tax=Streptomyces sp. NPDC002176 TaxID=3364634 RepID=UPI003850AD66